MFFVPQLEYSLKGAPRTCVCIKSMDAKEFFAFLVSLIVSLGIIVTIVALGIVPRPACYLQRRRICNENSWSFFCSVLGWFCVWKFFLCRFRLVRELLGTANEGSSNNSNGTRPEDKESSPSSSVKLNGRRDSRKGTTTVTTGAYKSTRSRSRKED